MCVSAARECVHMRARACAVRVHDIVHVRVRVRLHVRVHVCTCVRACVA